jgi:hypothetical protein
MKEEGKIATLYPRLRQFPEKFRQYFRMEPPNHQNHKFKECDWPVYRNGSKRQAAEWLPERIAHTASSRLTVLRVLCEGSNGKP